MPAKLPSFGYWTSTRPFASRLIAKYLTRLKRLGSGYLKTVIVPAAFSLTVTRPLPAWTFTSVGP